MELKQELKNMIFSLYYLTINKYIVNDWIKNKFVLYSYQEENKEPNKPKKKRARYVILNEVNTHIYLFIYMNGKVLN